MALVLVPLGPLLSRTRPAVRVASVLLVLGWFVVLTRAEPSVVRAATMAALAACARWRGHDREPFRLLCVAVVLIVTLDPSIVASVGWWLSVGATAGVCTVGRWLVDRLRLPRPLAGAVGISIGAQVGVAVPMWLTIGPVPVLGVAANVLAVPVASLVKMYGLPASVLAGLLDPVAPWLASALMWPVGPGLWWTEQVATVAATATPGTVGSIVLWAAMGLVTLVALGPPGGTTSNSDGDPPPDR